MKVFIIGLVLSLGLSSVALAHRKPDNLEYSLHKYYEKVMFHKSFFDRFAKELFTKFLSRVGILSSALGRGDSGGLTTLVSSLGTGLAMHGMGGNFNTGVAIGLRRSASYIPAAFPYDNGHIYAFGRCFVDEALTYAADVSFCDQSFIKVQYDDYIDRATRKMSLGGRDGKFQSLKSTEYAKCRDWALELHKRKLNKCKEYTSPDQIAYLKAISNRIKDEQANPHRYWDKSDAYETRTQ